MIYTIKTDDPSQFQKRIQKSRESVKKGLFLTDEELDNEYSRW